MDRLYEVALTMVPGVSSRIARAVLSLYPSAEELFRLPSSELKQLFAKRPSIAQAIKDATPLHQAEAELNFAVKHNIQVLYYTDEAFPQRLNRPDCDDCPVIIYYKGVADLNAPRAVGVVGTRMATEYGKSMVHHLLDDLRNESILVVSGLAYGIDSEAHREALNCNLPTVAVVAHGLDTIYPSANRSLAAKMAQTSGGILTEYPHGTEIRQGMFPARNRIIAALCDVVIVVEASVKGGALITANLAHGYHREILAVPGRHGDKYSEGCNRLIAANKAQLITEGEDLMATMNWDRTNAKQSVQTSLQIDLSDNETMILKILDENDTPHVDVIHAKCQLSWSDMVMTLLQLELKGLCKALPGARYKKM